MTHDDKDSPIFSRHTPNFPLTLACRRMFRKSAINRGRGEIYEEYRRTARGAARDNARRYHRYAAGLLMKRYAFSFRR